jgi:catechol 2,3-dioxygenase-like lactoylglutathione lyase family enzyme
MSSAQSSVTKESPWTGGCQCGAIRFRARALGRPSLCHCRMCQKAFGSIGGALVTVEGLTWTRGALKHFNSSNSVRRGFCANCGTPLTFEYKSMVDVAIAAFDRAGEIAPAIQMERAARLPWVDQLNDLPLHPPEQRAALAARLAAVVSYQHPDHDTDSWPMTASAATSADRAAVASSARGCQRAMPVLGTKDMARSLAFYRDKLGFAGSTWGEPATFAILQRGMVTLALAYEAAPAVSRNWAAYVYVGDVDGLYRELLASGVALTEPPQVQPWNCREFVVDDPDGHMLAFGQVLCPDPLGPGLSANLGRDTPR